MTGQPLDFTIRNVNNAIEKSMVKLAAATIRRIKTRLTRQGTDIRGKKFPPYSKSYAKFREENNRETGHVNLQFHGHMVGNIQVIEEPRFNQIIIGFPSGEQGEKARKMTELKGEFLGLTDKQQTELAKLARELLKDVNVGRKTIVIRS